MDAFSIKGWCDNTLSPMAWSRVLTRLLPYLNQKGFFFQDLQEPKEGTVLPPDVINEIRATIHEIYQENMPV